MRFDSPIQRIRVCGMSALLLLTGYLAGSLTGPVGICQAEIRSTPQRQAFESGSERSEKVLREMLSVLTKLEGRVANIESATKTLAHNSGK